MKRTLSIVLCLTLLMSSFVFASPVNRPTLSVDIESIEEISVEKTKDEAAALLNADTFPITFDKGTGDEVSNMPEGIEGSGLVQLDTTEPQREGYAFMGWKTSLDSKDVVTSVNVTGETTLYAAWAEILWEEDFNDSDLGYNEILDREVTISVGRGKDAKIADGVYSFTTTGNDPEINIDRINVNANKGCILEIKMAVGVQTTIKPKIYFCNKYYTSDEYIVAKPGYSSDPKFASWGVYTANGITATFDGKGEDEFVTFRVDMSAKANWKENVVHLAIYPNAAIGTETLVKLDNIRILTNTIESVEVKGIEAPVAKAAAPSTAQSADESKYTVESVTWEPALLYDYYFYGDTEYTANVTIKTTDAMKTALSNEVFSALVNGMEADSYVLNDDGTATLSYTFPATEHVDSIEATILTFITPLGDVQEQLMFTGDEYDLSQRYPTDLVTGIRFRGWSTEEGNLSKVIQSVVVGSEPMTFYAIYEPNASFNFADTYERQGVKLSNGKDVVFDEKGFAVVTPASNSEDVSLMTAPVGFAARDYAFAEVVVDAVRASKHYDALAEKEIFFKNKFSTDATPVLKFAPYNENADSAEFNLGGEGTIIAAEYVTVNGVKCIKYTYDLTKSENWKGTIGRVAFAPYAGFPIWAVSSITFIESNEFDGDVVISDLDAPETWGALDTAITANNGAFVETVEWEGALNEYGKILPNTVYSVRMVIRPESGEKFTDDTAVIYNDEVLYSEFDEEKNVINAYFDFAQTSALEDIVVEVTGAQEISRNGQYKDYSAKVTTVDGESLPESRVIWSVRNADPEIQDVLATITQDGRLFPVLDGEVIVVATPVYNADAAPGEIAVTLRNQKEKYRVTFDKNTQADVSGMPEDTFAKGSFVPEGEPTREDGYVFLGWTTSDSSAKVLDVINVAKDTTLYAVWEKTEWFEDFEGDLSKYNFNVIKATNIVHDTASGTYQYTTSASGDTEMNFYNLSIDADNCSVLEIKVAADTPELLIYKVYYANRDWETGEFIVAKPGIPEVPEYQKPLFANWAKYEGGHWRGNFISKGIDEYVTMKLDFCDNVNRKWYGETTHIALYFIGAPTNATFKFDYFKLIDPTRELTLNANGGMFSDETITKMYQSGQETTTISDVPTRAGYKFMGWSKDPSSTEKLYHDSIFMMDDITLYAIWNPTTTLANLSDGELSETVVADDETQLDNMDITSTKDGVVIKSTEIVEPIIKVVDSLEVTETTNTVLTKIKHKYSSMTSSGLVLRFKAEGQDEYTYVTIEENMPTSSSSKYLYYQMKIEDDAFTGTVTDVELILPEGVISSLTVSEIVFTDEITAQSSIDAFYSKKTGGNSAPSSETGKMKDWSNEVVTPDNPPSNPTTPTTPTTPTEPDPAETDSTVFDFVNEYVAGQFEDVKQSDWFYGDVEKAYKLGFMDGMTDTSFDPNGSLTVAQAITMAVRLNAKYNEKTIEAAEGADWYKPYVDYALENGIIKKAQFADYNAPVTRRQVALVFYNAMPHEWFTAINSFSVIPDVKANSGDFGAIITLYNAGIIVGIDNDANFAPDANIKRSEISAIINRIALPDSRIKV